MMDENMERKKGIIECGAFTDVGDGFSLDIVGLY